MSTASAEKTRPDELDLLCYSLYLRAVSGDQYLADTIPSELSPIGRACALYAIAQGTMMNRRVSPGAYAATEQDIALMSCRQLSEKTTQALQWIA